VGDFQGKRARSMTKAKIERWTLWVLAVGILATATFNVAKSIVKEYNDLQHEIHRPAATQAGNDGSTE
jgi:hypothetical protein